MKLRHNADYWAGVKCTSSHTAHRCPIDKNRSRLKANHTADYWAGVKCTSSHTAHRCPIDKNRSRLKANHTAIIRMSLNKVLPHCYNQIGSK